MAKLNDKNKKEICSTLFYKQNNVGFTLLEVIVAIFIINTSIVGALGFITFFINARGVANNRLIAINLAQEGMEITRNLRDTNSDWSGWPSIIPSGDISTHDYLVQYDSTDFLNYENKPLKLNSDGMYNYNSGLSTFFYRTISLNKISDYETKVVSTINWSQRGINHKVSAEDRLFDWQ